MKMKPKTEKNRVPADPTKWSDSSKRSYSYAAFPPFYEDLPYNCWHCGKASIFSASDQKVAFEEKKAYIWQRRMLCRECWSDEQKIASTIRACQTKWNESKSLSQ